MARRVAPALSLCYVSQGQGDTHMAERRRKFWGWGWEDEDPTAEQQERLGQALAARFGLASVTVAPPPRLSELTLRRPRLDPPASLAAICSTDPYERAGHTYGKAFRDVVRAFERHYPNPPDVVALPRTEEQLVALLDWAS